MDISQLSTVTSYQPVGVLPDGANDGLWVGRVWLPAHHAADGLAGPRVVTVKNGVIHETGYATMSDLINDPGSATTLAHHPGQALLPVDEVLSNSLFYKRATHLREESEIVLLAPNDLLATKACGVTFVRSLLERVVEEKAKGDPAKAREIRILILESLGDDLSRVEPGSPETERLKEKLIAAGVWSQYLEVGIGKDAEIFTKAQPMSSVGYGAQVGILPDSSWNNPEPEIVLAVAADGTIRGATLGNDVNLRDYEGRSALLLGEAKDQNGSCSIGPFIRLFDSTFSLEDVTRLEVGLRIFGADGFQTSGSNRMSEISRPPQRLAAQACSRHHQYPDGFMLFLGTMFAPTEDRGGDGLGFTHHCGDRVEISAGPLGTLVNWVNHTNTIPPWDYGTGDLCRHLIERAARIPQTV